MPPLDENDVRSLFTRPEGAEQTAVPEPVVEVPVEPAGGQQTPTPVGPDVSGLQQQVNMLSGLVGNLFRQGFERQAPVQQPVKQEDDPFSEVFKPKPFFTQDDAVMLLNGNQPIEVLNKMGNQIKESVAAPLVEIIKKQRQELQAWQQHQQEREYRMGQQQAAEQADKEFFEKFSDLKDMQGVVRYEAAMLAEQAKQNPALLAGKSREEAASMLAERVRGLRKQWAGEGQAVETVAATPGARRSPYSERGGTARVSSPAQSKDPNVAGLREMSSHLQRRRQR